MSKKVTFNQVSLKDKHFTRLHNLTFSLDTGKIVGLLGRNGAGKTSLLSLLASYQLPIQGKVLIDGEEAFENDEKMEQVIFIYPTNYSEEEEKVSDAIHWYEQYYPKFDRDYAESLLEKFHLPLNKMINKLSRGMYSALYVSLGLASRAPITIFDEAYLSMDAPSRELFYQELRSEQLAHPRLIIMSTHLVSETERLFDEVILIDQGKLLFHEDYESFISKGAVVIGPEEQVTALVAPYRNWEEQRLGDLISVIVFGDDIMDVLADRSYPELEVKPATLQQLFIHLTKESDDETT